MKDGTDWGPRFALIGDMGNVNAKSLGALQEETQLGHFDSILHVGDFAYDLATVSSLFIKNILKPRIKDEENKGGRFSLCKLYAIAIELYI